MAENYIYDDSYDQIHHVDFDVLDNSEIERMSALGPGPGIEIPEAGTGEHGPKKGGLSDARLGTCSNDTNCVTCGMNTDCGGHFGHITLADIVFHVGYLQFTHKILTCVCRRCSKLLVHKNEDELREILSTKSKKECMAYVRAAVKNVVNCQHCGAQVSKIKIEIKKASGLISIVSEIEPDNKDENEGKKKLRQELTPDMVYHILKNISDNDCRSMGMDPKRSRPESMLHVVFPVPPVQMRPSSKGDFMGGASMEDDLTHKLADIIKANSRIIRNKESQTENTIKFSGEHTHLLQYQVGSYLDNDTLSLMKDNKGKQFKSLSSRLKGKTGRVRGNLMGKRGNYTSRTVITSDPTIGNNQLGVPVKIAMILTFPEVVTPNNIDFLKKLVSNGMDQYPGANYVFKLSKRETGRRVLPIQLRYQKGAVELQYGDVVERHMLDNDIVLLNRQPTLHKQSMMGHRVKVINDPTLMTYRLSVAITTPYNADFDGDEMNVFFPQSLQTQIELEEIACVEKQIISPTSSKTVIGIVQDGLLGAYNLTDPKLKIDWRSAMNIMSYTSIENFKSLKKNKDYTGSELYSLILPQGINVTKGTFKIRNGQLLEGRLSKDMLGAKKKNNLVQLIWDGYGVEETKKFIDNTQRLINNFNLWHGFSVGIGDIIVPAEIHKQVEIKFQTKELEVEQLITEIENNPDIMPQDVLEHKIFSTLTTIRDDASQLAIDNLQPNNSFGIMAWSGSKGDKTHIGQMVMCLGLQAFEGKLIPKKYNGRTFPYYFQNDDRAESRGLVKSNFIKGLDYPEYAAHMMAARLGIIEQAIKSVTGDTEIIIQENGEIKTVEIGNWIDEHMNANIDKIVHESEKDMELLKIDTDVYIPTCDAFGNTSWEQLTHVTRHDPTDRMFKITTLSGRTVCVADSKSLLIWNDHSQKFEPELTHLVEVGDFVPVTHTLAAPPIITSTIDMTKYLPKTEYLYGTDYHLADTMTREAIAMHGNGRVPNGFWATHNGTTFTVPFWRPAGLLRSTSGRSNTKTIKDGYIYSFSKSREHGLPAEFPLNRENGVFIGLFLADGNANPSGGHVQITKEDLSIRKFVTEWFAKMNITCTTYVQTKNVGKNKDIAGTSTAIQGYSMPLVTFLTKLVGHMSENKYVPNEAFSAPDEFVIGLLDGYFSGDGSIDNSSITAGSVSQKLIEGINLLCARFGIFGKVTKTQQKHSNLGTENIRPMYTISIRSQWARLFKNTIKLTHSKKNAKLQSISTSDKHLNFPTTQDVVFDKIVKIEELNVNHYAKLYDVTVPQTLNFMTQNGLQLRDTAETGYVQRKLIKSMEDIMIKYDGTVRSANDRLIQLVYGDTGTDTTKQYEYSIKLIEYNNDEVRANCVFTKEELKSIKGFSEKDNEQLYLDMISQRNYVRKTVRNSKMNYIQEIKNFMLPVNFNRIIDNIAGSDLKGDELSAKYIVEQIDRILLNENTTIVYMSKEDRENKNSFKRKDDMAHKHVFKLALFDAFAPKKLIMKLKLNKAHFDAIVEETISSFNKNMIEPGEQAGIIAAQSIGEPLTQMSVAHNTIIIIRKISSGKTFYGKVGEFIDDLLEQNLSQVINVPHHLNSVLLDTNDYEILSVMQNEKTKWSTISQVSKHPANGDLMKVTTKTGRSVTTTKSHSHLKRMVNSIVPIEGSKLKVGDAIPIARNIPEIINPQTTVKIGEQIVKLDHKFGWFCGIYLAGGIIDFDTVQTQMPHVVDFFVENFGETHNKKIDGFIFGTNLDYIAGLLNGFIDANDNSNENICISSPSCELISAISTLFSYFGICGSLYKDTQYNFKIDDHCAEKILSDIGVTVVEKQQMLEKIVSKVKKEVKTNFDPDVYWDPIVSIEEIKDCDEYVYDFTVPESETFMTNEGVLVHNTLNSFHSVGIASMSATVQGVPRMKELLSVSKNPKTPQMVIYLTSEYMSNKDMAHKIASHIKYTTLGDTRGRINVYYDPNPTAKGGFMEKDNVKNISFQQKNSRSGCQADVNGLPWLMRIELDREKMLEKEVTLLEIKSKFCNWWEKRFNDTKVIKGEEKKVLNKINQLTILTNSDNDEQPVLHVRFNVKDGEKDKFNMGTIDNFIDLIIDKFKLKGLNSIINVPAIQEERLLTTNEKTGNEDKLTQYVIYATGVNLLDIRYFNGVDLNKTITNNIMDMYEIFGIEIARAVLLKEIAGAYSNAGSEVNYQHVTMIVDQMTAMGTINSIDRHGMNKSDSDPFARASFEKTVEQLLIASVYGETDFMRSVSSRIMAGAVIRGGTGFPEIEFDTNLVEKSEHIEGIDFSKNFVELGEDTLAKDVIGKKDEEIFIPL